MKTIILSFPLPTQILQITHLWVITHRLGTTDLDISHSVKGKFVLILPMSLVVISAAGKKKKKSV